MIRTDLATHRCTTRTTALPAYLTLLAAVAAAACAKGNGTDTKSGTAAVTNIPESAVQNQGETGNCWLYATGAWIESVEAEVPGNPGTTYSPAYWDYWNWHDQILAGATNIQFGGYWGWAVDIVKRYGMVPMGSFVSDDAAGAVSALNAINVALASGALSSPASRSDSAQVLAALNAAFGISSAQAQGLADTFGAEGTNTFDNGATASSDFSTVTRAQDILVETPIPGGIVIATKLDKLFGTSAGTANPDDRVGEYAWTAAYPPAYSSAPPARRRRRRRLLRHSIRPRRSSSSESRIRGEPSHPMPRLSGTTTSTPPISNKASP